jgi:protein-disulfide isomerase
VDENTPGYLLVMCTVGLGVVLYLAYGAFVVLETVCVLCLATYVAVIGLLVVAATATSHPMSTLPARAWRDLRGALRSPVSVLSILLLGAGVASAIASFPKEPRKAPPLAAFATTGPAVTASPPATAQAAPAPAAPAVTVPQVSAQEMAQLEAWLSQQPRAIVPVDGGGAAVIIVKFHDFQCPPCRQVYYDYKPVLQKYATQSPGKVRLIEKHFPIDPECNVNTPTGAHLAACEAAAGVIMAKAKGPQLEDWLFSNQTTLTPMGVKVAARDIGGVTDFDAQYPRALEQVKADIALGKLLNVGATPSFFINGVLVRGGAPPQYFDALIALELKKAGL